MSKEKFIIIGGGVGPEASNKLQQKINKNTIATGDQEHPSVIHLSIPKEIPDRTDYLLGKVSVNPAVPMSRGVKAGREAGKIIDKNAEFVCGVPCNTFHADKIFSHFKELLKKENMNDVKVLNMLEETGDLIKETYPNAKKIGLMSTSGTRKVGVYIKVLEPNGFEIVEVAEKLQPELHDSIYNKDWGIKAQSNPVSKKARDKFIKYVGILEKKKVDVIILGCTEIPLALPEAEINGIPLIDPMDALARALVREANPKKLKPMPIFEARKI